MDPRNDAELLARLHAARAQLTARAAAGEDVAALRQQIDDALAQTTERVLKNTRGGSRFAGIGASPDVMTTLAAGGTLAEPGADTGHRAAVGNPADDRQQRAMRLMRGMKALAEGTPSAGGYLVPVELYPEITQLIRARTAVMKLKPKLVDVDKELDVPAMTTGASASWTAENAPIVVSEQTFGIPLTLSPKELSALVPMSNRVLRDASSNPSIAEAVTEDLAAVIALGLDAGFLAGTGSEPQPRGILNVSDTTAGPDLGTDGASITFDELKAIPAKLRALNAPFMSPGWVFNARLLETLELLKDADGRYLAETDLLSFDATGGGGTLLGFPFVTTSQLPTTETRGSSTDASTIVFGSDWSTECWLGVNQAFTLDLSNEASYGVPDGDGGTTWVSAYQNKQTLFRANAAYDIGLRRPGLFVVTRGVRPLGAD
jgi:HK97 family phage major capsid protein